jgi:hypothetical protein
MGRKVYIVTAGKYSDYHIAAVFSTREMAEKCVEVVNRENPYSTREDPYAKIEEWEVDEVPPGLHQGYDVWNVYMKEDGTVTEVWKELDLELLGLHLLSSKLIEERKNGEVCYHVICLAKDEKHAIKIASEKLMMFKARKEGIT